MGGRGSRSMTQTTPTPRTTAQLPDWQEAFSPGTDYQASGDVDHNRRTVSWQLQQEWDQYTAPYETGITDRDRDAMMKDYEWETDSLFGYFRTTNAMAINAALYDPKNAGKTISQIFTRTDKNGRKRDLRTVRTMDKAVQGHVTPRDATYTRFCSPQSIGRSLGLTDAQVQVLAGAASLSQTQLKKLNSAMIGRTSFTKGYTSASANRSMNAFSDPKASQSKNYIFERKLYVPKGTHAYAPRRNAQESEVLFGRNLQTKVIGVSVAKDGHVVIHEMYDGNK